MQNQILISYQQFSNQRLHLYRFAFQKFLSSSSDFEKATQTVNSKSSTKNMGHNWIDTTSDSPLPPFAVLGGHDCDGSPIYVGRAFHEGDTLPAKVVPNKLCAYVSWGGVEIEKTNYEVLVGENYRFVPCFPNLIPANAVPAGNTVDGETLYIGRGSWESSETVGKIHPTHHCLYIPFGGAEHRLESYEILIRDQLDIWVPASLHEVPANAVVAGQDTDSSTIFVARAYHNGEILPAKFIPNIGSAYVSYDGRDIYKDSFEVLIGFEYSWVDVSETGGNIPIGAVSTGKTQNGEKVYIGRGHYRSSLTPGKVLPGKNCVYIAYGGREVKINNDYEILVRNS